MIDESKGILFDDDFQQSLKEKFYYAHFRTPAKE